MTPNSFGCRNGGGPIRYEATEREITEPVKRTGGGDFYPQASMRPLIA